MSLGYTVGQVQIVTGLENGRYRGQIIDVSRNVNDSGTYVVFYLKVISPSSYAGRTHKESFNMNNEWGLMKFEKICQDIGGLEKGEEADAKHFLYKMVDFYIINKVSEKNGRNYANIESISLVESDEPGQSKQDYSGTINTYNDPTKAILESEKLTMDPSKTEKILAMAGIQLPSKPTASSGVPLNDEVPF